MGKAYGLHQIELREGVTPEDFEKFITEEWCSLPSVEGVSSYLLEGVKGKDEGKYVLAIEVESAERYDELYLPPTSGEVRQWLEENAAAWERLQAMAERTFTDYVVVE